MKRERIIYAFILVFIALGAVYFSRDESDMMGNERKHFWVVKTHSDTKSDVVFAGDSRVYRGISPDDFEKGCPSKEALNLGYISNGFHPDYLNFLEQRLKSSDEQSVVVCGITPFAFSRKGSLSSHYWNEKYQTKKEEVIVNMHLYHLSRMIIPYDLKIMLGGNRVKRKDIPYQEFFHLNGWMESTWIHPDSTSALKSYQSTFTDNMFDEEGAKIFFRQVQEWTEKGIMVVGMRMPTSFAMKALEDSLSGFDEVRFRNTFTENGGQWLDFDFSEYTSYDGSHLDNESARRFSFELGQKVQDILKEE